VGSEMVPLLYCIIIFLVLGSLGGVEVYIVIFYRARCFMEEGAARVFCYYYSVRWAGQHVLDVSS